jgi:glycine cleavage system H protein
MNFPKELRYTKEHEWIRDEGGTATVGVTDYAQEKLGDVVFVEMPETGVSIQKGDAFGVVESVKAASDVYCPVGGEVIEINHALEEHPEFVNQSPYGDGWIIKVKVTDSSAMNDLMDAGQYQAFVEQEESK